MAASNRTDTPYKLVIETALAAKIQQIEDAIQKLKLGTPDTDTTKLIDSAVCLIATIRRKKLTALQIFHILPILQNTLMKIDSMQIGEKSKQDKPLNPAMKKALNNVFAAMQGFAIGATMELAKSMNFPAIPPAAIPYSREPFLFPTRPPKLGPDGDFINTTSTFTNDDDLYGSDNDSDKEQNDTKQDGSFKPGKRK